MKVAESSPKNQVRKDYEILQGLPVTFKTLSGGTVLNVTIIFRRGLLVLISHIREL